MIEIASIVAVCKTALDTGKQAAEAYRKKKLSDVEKELLAATAKDGEFFLHSVDQIPGSWVRVGGKDFLDQQDPAVAAGHLEAFRSLCQRGYITHEGGKLFMLTGSGFERARAL